MLRKISHWFAAVLVALSLLLSLANSASAKTADNLYGPATVQIVTQCSTPQVVVNLPIDPKQIQGITVNGQVNGDINLHDQNGLINTNVSGQAPYSFTTTSSDVLYACLNDGSGTVSFQGQILMETNNWAGYTVEGFASSPNQYQIATGDWQVPAVTCAGLVPKYDSATWLGLGGAPDSGSKKIEQIGTEQDCTSTLASYHAVYENYPDDVVVVYSACKDGSNPCSSTPATVAAGDSIHAEVSNRGNGVFLLLEHDFTQHWYISLFGNESGGADPSVQYSAEWILEYPGHPGSWGLANFQQVSFQNCRADGFTIPNAGPSIQQITMVDASHNIMAQPSALSSSGDSFTVSYVASS
jgi:hypothetical protein